MKELEQIVYRILMFIIGVLCLVYLGAIHQDLLILISFWSTQ